MKKRKASTAQYNRLIGLSSIKLQSNVLLKELNIAKALAQMPDTESPEQWAEMAREAAASLLALAEKISPPVKVDIAAALRRGFANHETWRRQHQPTLIERLWDECPEELREHVSGKKKVGQPAKWHLGVYICYLHDGLGWPMAKVLRFIQKTPKEKNRRLGTLFTLRRKWRGIYETTKYAQHLKAAEKRAEVLGEVSQDIQFKMAGPPPDWHM